MDELDESVRNQHARKAAENASNESLGNLTNNGGTTISPKTLEEVNKSRNSTPNDVAAVQQLEHDIQRVDDLDGVTLTQIDEMTNTIHANEDGLKEFTKTLPKNSQWRKLLDKFNKRPTAEKSREVA